MNKTMIGIATGVLCAAGLTETSRAGAFVFATEANGIELIVHPIGYEGLPVPGQKLVLSVAARRGAFPPGGLQDIIDTIRIWNEQEVTVGNLLFGDDNDIPEGFFDFESTVTHEFGHALGLAHNNAASESGLPSSQSDYGKATNGINDEFDIAPGIDGVIGTSDDERGDDINLNWKNVMDNPFFLPAGPIDPSVYSRSDTFVNIGSRQVAALGFPGVPVDTEAVMNQGAFPDESQRTLTADDVAAIQIAQAGVDRMAGTSDDYQIQLAWVGEIDADRFTETVDIFVDWSESVGFAATSLSGAYIDVVGDLIGHMEYDCELGNTVEMRERPRGITDHAAVTESDVLFNPNFDWHFGPALDCNGNTVPDTTDIDVGFSLDNNFNGVPDECESQNCDGDVNLDLIVNVNDITFVVFRLGDIGTPGMVSGDADGNGTVEVNDITYVIFRFGLCI